MASPTRMAPSSSPPRARRNRGIPSRAVQPRTRFLKVSALNETPKQAVERFQTRERRRLVRRQHLLGIVAAWVITVPATAGLAALAFFLLGVTVL